jgi:subtilase family serine protease
LAAVLPVLAACGGSGASSPAVPQTALSANTTPLQSLDGVPAGAIAGSAVFVHLPLRNGSELDGLLQAQTDKNSPEYHHFLTPGQFRDRYAPAGADIATAAAALKALGFHTWTTSQGVVAAAPQATIESVFGVRYRASAQSAVRGGAQAVATAQSAAVLPQALRTLGATVALPRRPFHVDSRRVSNAAFPDNRYSATGPYWFDDLKQAYEYPSYQRLNGAGATIGIVMSSDVLDSDTAQYFEHEHLPAPHIVRRAINGGAGAFDPNNPASDEASLDVQQSLGSAPGASLVLYSTPDLYDTNILLAYQAIVDENRVDIVSSSFGGCELYYTAAYNGGTDFTYYLTQLYHDIFRQGNAQGITWVASSGDNGAYGCTDTTFTTPAIGVESPADDPDVVAVGGTNLTTASNPPSRNSAYVTQNASSDTFDANDSVVTGYPPYITTWGSGGGVSVVFSRPWYQYLAPTGSSARTVPDVAMHMGGCPIGTLTPCNPPDRSSVVTAIGGSYYLLIGTSASSPEFAGLLAVTEQNLGTRLGNANGYIYPLSALGGSSVFRSGIPGDDGYYHTKPGYDYVTGLGTPRAGAFALYDGPLAGVPLSQSNP